MTLYTIGAAFNELNADADMDSVEYPLSEEDIKRLLPNVRVLIYPELEQFESIDELIEQPNAVVYISHEDEDTIEGHWVAIFRSPDGLPEVFDPYGLGVDKELNFFSRDQRIRTNQYLPWLTALLIKSDYDKYWYNHVPFQKEADDISTCGRWVITRLAFSRMPYNEFVSLFRNTTDQEITDWTNMFLLS